MADHPSLREVHADSLAAGHETTDAGAGPLLQIGIGMAALIVVAFIGVIVLYKVLSYYQPQLNDAPHPLTSTRVVSMSEPALEVDSPRLRVALQAAEDKALTTYGWVDQEQGLARIPISRAIDLLVERGLPVKADPGAAAQ